MAVDHIHCDIWLRFEDGQPVAYSSRVDDLMEALEIAEHISFPPGALPKAFCWHGDVRYDGDGNVVTVGEGDVTEVDDETTLEALVRDISKRTDGVQPHVFPKSAECTRFVARIYSKHFNDGKAVRGEGATYRTALLELREELFAVGAVKCEKCGKDRAGPTTVCPYSQDIEGKDMPCNCCHACVRACTDDI